MKFIFWSLIFFGNIISNGHCAAVEVMHPTSPHQSSPHQLDLVKEKFLKETYETANYMQKELEGIKSTLGEAAFISAYQEIGRLSTINKATLKAIFDAEKSKTQHRQETPHLKEFINLFNTNSMPNWNLEELEKNIPGSSQKISLLELEKIYPICWEVIMKELAGKIKPGGNDNEKLQEAIKIIGNQKEAFDQVMKHCNIDLK